MTSASSNQPDWVLPTIIATALALPWLVSSDSQPPLPNGPSGIYQSGINQSAVPSMFASTGQSAQLLRGDQNGPDYSAPPLEFLPVNQLSEVLRFDITPDWIAKRWDRVARIPVESNLTAHRVALVTGTNAWDLHGSMSYFFDNENRLQRILFRGWTGELSQLEPLLTGPLELKSRQSSRYQLYTLERWGTLCSAALIQQATHYANNNPHQKFAIHLEVNHPQSNLVASPETSQLVQSARQ